LGNYKKLSVLSEELEKKTHRWVREIEEDKKE
jgi:hypothetical protein